MGDFSQSDSRIVLATALKPLPEAQWETTPDSNLAGSIYGDSIEVIDLANADMMSVVNTVTYTCRVVVQ